MLACGTPPYREAKAGGPGAVLARVLTEPPTPLLQHNPKLTPSFVALVERLMNKDPEKRFANAEDAVKAFELCKIGKYNAKPAAAASMRRTAQQKKISNFKQMMIGAACAVVFLFGLGIIANKNKNSGNKQPAPAMTSSTSTGDNAETKMETVPPPQNPPVTPPVILPKTSTDTKSDNVMAPTF